MSELLDDLLADFRQLPPETAKQVVEDAQSIVGSLSFVPNPGPQTLGYFCEADILLFGGNPGGGKTALEVGLALNCHDRTLIARKAFADLDAIIDVAKRMVGSDENFTGGGRPRYSKPDGGVVHFVGLGEKLGGKQGWDHDLICVDEAAQCTETEVRMLLGWLRTNRKGQRCRMVLASNPPLDSTGDWLVQFFAPWLDPTHPNPAKPGELRYFLPDENGKDRECGKDDTTVIAGVTVSAQSRSFIPSTFKDNPYYSAEDYAKTLAGLPAEYREILMSGNFMLARKDQPFQAIPTAWVRAAQQRWTEKPPPGVPMCAMGIDPSGGGEDPMAIAIRHDAWFAPLIMIEGHAIPKDRPGAFCAGQVLSYRTDDADVIIDMGGGYGGPMYERLIENIGNKEVHAHKGAEKSTARTRDKKFGFFNKRSQVIWQFREALDPDQPGGSPVALPPDPMLVSDLTAPTYEITPHGYKIEPKEDVCARLGRSTNKGDAVVNAWSRGGRMKSHFLQWSLEDGGKRRKQIQVDLGPRRR